MADVSVITKTGESGVVDDSVIDEFKATLRGTLLRSGDDGYDEARKVFNAMIDRKPAMIVRCAGVADVISSVNFARENNLLVSVRGGGHNIAGNSTCDGGIMIDLSLMTSIHVDPSSRIAHVEGGATWRDFDHETQAFGLATTGGFIPTTGVAGLTLGGGVGWLMGKYGLSLDNLLSVDIVTADGQFVRANANQNQELFWGVRGGGGNFGIATSFSFQLHQVGPIITGGLVVHPIEKAKETLQFFREFTKTVPEDVRCVGALLTSPEGDPAAAILACHCGSLEDGEKTLKPLKEFGSPLEDHIGPMPYTALQGMLLDGFPPGQQHYWKSNFMNELSDDAIEIMVDQFAKAPAPQTVVVVEQVGGAVGRIGHDDTAFNHRDAVYNFLILGTWPEPSMNQTGIQWVRDFWDEMQPYSSGGVYVNYLGQEGDEGADRIRAAYGDQKYQRLVALKNKYDPTNMFRLNQNIRPTE